jgi:uncharacterized protein (TIGR03086 family)
MDSVVHLDAQAVRASVRVVTTAARDDLTRPTPCAGWTLADLIAHMAAQHDGFAAAAAGEGADLGRWPPKRYDPDTLVTEYVAAADRVLAAFSADGVLDRPFELPEITTQFTFPARRAIAFHLVDYVVHGWDVARSLGLRDEPELEPGVLAAAHRVALAVPEDNRQPAPGAAFAPRLPVSAGASTLDSIVALLGRAPDWPALPYDICGRT